MLLAIVVTVTVIGFYRLSPRTQYAANLYFERAAAGIIGTRAPQAGPLPINGGWCLDYNGCTAPVCGTGIETRQCACPSPANGGAPCYGASTRPCQGPNPVTQTWSIAYHSNPGASGHCHEVAQCGRGLLGGNGCCDPSQTPTNLREDVACTCYLGGSYCIPQ